MSLKDCFCLQYFWISSVIEHSCYVDSIVMVVLTKSFPTRLLRGDMCMSGGVFKLLSCFLFVLGWGICFVLFSHWYGSCFAYSSFS